MKIFDLFKSKNKTQQQAQQDWTLKMASIIPQGQVMELSVDEIHNRVRLAEISYNCITAAEGYFEIIAPICPIREDVAHSLLRIAMRPLFYLGIVRLGAMLEEIKHLTRNNQTFLKWLSDNHGMVELIIAELRICGLLGFFDYDNVKDIVVLKPPDKNVTDFFEETPDMSAEEFPSFCDFKNYFYSLFSGYVISQDEIDRLILEEAYEKDYYGCMTKPIRTRYTHKHDYRYEITKLKGGMFQVCVQKSVRENPKSYSLLWNALPGYIYIADTIECAEEIGSEALRKL